MRYKMISIIAYKNNVIVKFKEENYNKIILLYLPIERIKS